MMIVTTADSMIDPQNAEANGAEKNIFVDAHRDDQRRGHNDPRDKQQRRNNQPRR
jgi:hypothetical protein